MNNAEQIKILNIPKMSAIYFALLQCGYDYYTFERNQEHINKIQEFIDHKPVPVFFSNIKQNTCEAYPYWPRAAIIEIASFYLSNDFSRFVNYDNFRNKILSANNISDNDRNQNLWDWLTDFPMAISNILNSNAFQRYLKWENEWIAKQQIKYELELHQLQEILNVCVNQYNSSIKNIHIIISPIKCAYSADYHFEDNNFIYSSGAFRIESIIHEFLHPIINPIILENKDIIVKNNKTYKNIDKSYYLTANGRLNALEEYTVRKLTKDILANNFPDDLNKYLASL